MLRPMILLLEGHTLHTSNAEKIGVCGVCSQGKFSLRASKWRLPTELPPALEHLQGDVCGPIIFPSDPFQYSFVLVDASGQYVDLSLLSTRNLIFPKLLAMLLKLRTHYPDVAMKALRVDNTANFRSHLFEDYCIVSGINLTYLVLYEHNQNGLAEAYIKKLQMVARPLLLHVRLRPATSGMLFFKLLAV